MDFNLVQHLQFVAVGLAVGAIVGLTGVGGGSLMTPLLTGVFGIAPTTAVGTDLAFAAITKGVGTVVHGFKQSVHWRAALLLVAGSLPAAALALLWIKSQGAITPELTRIIKLSIAVSVFITAIALVFRGRWLAALRARPHLRLHGKSYVLAMLAAGVLIGALVTVSSIGAGAVGATLLLLLNPEWEPADVAGTDIAFAVPLTAFAAAGHAWLGHVDVSLLLALLEGSIPGIALGSLVAKRLPEKLTRSLLVGTLTAAGTKMVL